MKLNFIDYPLNHVMYMITELNDYLSINDKHYHDLLTNCYSHVENLKDVLDEYRSNLYDDYDKSFVSLANREAATAIITAMQHFKSKEPETTPTLYSDNPNYKECLNKHNSLLDEMENALPKKIFDLVKSNEIAYRTYSVSIFYNQTLKFLNDAAGLLL